MPLENILKLIVQSWLHCFITLCFIFLENQGNNFHTMLMWILNEINICKEIYTGSSGCVFPISCPFLSKQEMAYFVRQKKFWHGYKYLYFFFINISLQNNYWANFINCWCNEKQNLLWFVVMEITYEILWKLFHLYFYLYN